MGAVFPTGSKKDAVEIDLSTVGEICRAVSIPSVAIGGITCENTIRLKGCGFAGIAVISALFWSAGYRRGGSPSPKGCRGDGERMMKGAIFDVDGTLLDTMHVWTDAGARYLATLGIEAEEGLGAKLFTMTVDMGAVYLKENYLLPQSLDEIKRGINGAVENYYFTEADFKPGARELLDQLQADGVRMAGGNIHRPGTCISAAFDRLACTAYFDVILTCGEVGASKSSPRIFYEAAEGDENAGGRDMDLRGLGFIPSKRPRRRALRSPGVYDAVSEADQEEIRALSDIYVRDLRQFDPEAAE